MPTNLKPNLIINRIDQLNLNALTQIGIKGLVIDIDNTLTRHDQLNCESWAVNFIAKAKEHGFKICLVSNNHQERVSPISRQLMVSSVWDAAKPSAHAYKNALELIQCKPQNSAAIGDQIFTDIIGGNNAGLFTVLVNPIHPDEAFKIKIFRPLEKIFRLIFRKNT